MNEWSHRTIHAPTSRLGGRPSALIACLVRARFAAGLVRSVGLVAVVVLVGACLAAPSAQRPPVAAALVGPVVVPRVAGGPPIECRGLSRDHCATVGSFEGDLGGVARTDIERVIVSCEGAPCTTTGGAMRLDLVLRDGTTVEVARGGYGEFRQP